MMYVKVLCKFSNVIIIITHYRGKGEDKEVEEKEERRRGRNTSAFAQVPG